MLMRFDFPTQSNDLFKHLFQNEFQNSSFPPTDVVEHEDEFVVAVEVPGVKREDLSITFKDNVLTLSGKRQNGYPENSTVLLNEVREHEFNRSLSFPHEIDVNNVSAELQNGILLVTVPKAAEAKAKQIEVKVK